MPFPRRLLSEREDLVLDLRPHWIALVWPIAAGIVIAVGTVLAANRTPRSWPDWVVIAELIVGVALLIAYSVRPIVGWLTSHFVVTSDRVIHREGWLARRSMEMPLERINDVKFKQSVFERLIGAGDLVIESGGEYGQNRFTDIRRPEHVQKTIFEVSEANQARMTSPPPPMRPTEPALDAYRTTEDVSTGDVRAPKSVEQLERLADLRDRGIINEAEFQEEKARILGDERG